MLILFDQGTPRPLKKHLPVHHVKTAWEMGWSEIENGQLTERRQAVMKKFRSALNLSLSVEFKICANVKTQ
jgi:hypothetical protein